VQQTQLEALERHLTSLKSIYDEVASTLISNRTREALDKPVNESIQCCNELRKLLDRFTNSQA
jgi:hypothetical protein